MSFTLSTTLGLVLYSRLCQMMSRMYLRLLSLELIKFITIEQFTLWIIYKNMALVWTIFSQEEVRFIRLVAVHLPQEIYPRERQLHLFPLYIFLTETCSICTKQHKAPIVRSIWTREMVNQTHTTASYC